MTDPTADNWLAEVRADAADRLARICEVQAELSTLHAEARGADGRVQVRVNAAGRLVGLTIDPGALSLSGVDLAGAILRAVDSAAGLAGERLAALVGSLVSCDEVDAMLTGRPSEADLVGVRTELEALRGNPPGGD